MIDLVATWTGWHANALRQALRMTNEEFAEHLDVGVRTVAYWRARPEMVPRQGMQQILDAALQQAPELARAQFRRLLAEHDSIEPPRRRHRVSVRRPCQPDRVADRPRAPAMRRSTVSIVRWPRSRRRTR